LSLCYERKRFLYEARPDLFPAGYLTNTEMELWGMYYDHIEKKRKSRSGRG